MDLYAQLRFLHFSGGFSEQGIFNTLITRPIKAGDPKAALRLQVLMAEICLRRRKDMKLQGKDIISLPGKDEYVHKIGITLLRFWTNENSRHKSRRNMSYSAKKLKDWFNGLRMVMEKDIPLFLRFFFE